MSFVTLYRAASRRVRINLWLTVGLLVNIASIPATARASGDSISHEWTEPSTVLAIFGVLVSSGIVLGEFRTVKQGLEQRARIDLVDEQFKVVMAEVRAVRELIERNDERWKDFLPTVTAWTNGVEAKVHAAQTSVARLEVLMERSRGN